jgi:hypothetical protein
VDDTVRGWIEVALTSFFVPIYEVPLLIDEFDWCEVGSVGVWYSDFIATGTGYSASKPSGLSFDVSWEIICSSRLDEVFAWSDLSP